MKLFALSTLAIASLLAATGAAPVPGASDSLDKRDPLPAKEYMYKLASESVERKNTDDILDKEYMYKLNAETTEPVDDSLDKREPLPGKEYMYKLASEKAEELLDEQ